jgi:hypothetical protein
MRRSLPLLAVVLVSASLHASPVQTLDPDGASSAASKVRQFIIQPEHVLSDDDKATLAAAGIDVRQALAEGRYIVRSNSAAALDSMGGLIRSAEPLSATRKLHPTALHQAAIGTRFARVSVIFDTDVAFDDARDLISATGGTLEELMSYEFEPMQRLVARVPSSRLTELASDVRILAIYGAPHLRMESENAISAELSSVTPLASAPYDLNGEGVVLSYFELAAADAAHREFTGRLNIHFTGGGESDAAHATHTAGTMIAAGLQPAAKGMAPAATLHGYDARSSSYLTTKDRDLAPLGVIADNNSWGYVFGWCTEPSCTNGWEWTGNEDLFGGYIDLNAAVDKTTRSKNVLFMQSAGNDAQKLGPTDAPFAHRHQDEDGETITDKTFCYSADGSGNDCPAAVCSVGAQFCEIIRHPVNAPFVSLGLLASSKNTLTVGAVSDATSIGSFSSRGPTRDGRVKPEIVARGVNVFSTLPGGAYGRKNGTSMSTPVVTGIAGLVAQQWRKTFAGASPLAGTIKTALIAGATDMGNAGPDYTFGFGLANAKATVDLIRDDNATGSRIRVLDATQGSQMEVPVTVLGTQNLRVTLGWSDPEVLVFNDDGTAGATLVNDLDVKVITPTGATVLPYVLDKNSVTSPATRGVNTVDNTEMVEIANAAPGAYRVIVSGTRITASSPQKYTLVTNAPMGTVTVPCTDATEPNSTAETAYGFLASSQSVMARFCTQDDIDFFKFRPDRPGTIKVVLTAVGTPLRATLTNESGTVNTTVDVEPGESRTLQASYAASTPSTFTVRVIANGNLVTGSSYSINATFPLSAPVRRRSAR